MIKHENVKLRNKLIYTHYEWVTIKLSNDLKTKEANCINYIDN